MHQKSIGCMDTILFLTIGKAGDVLSPFIGYLAAKLRIY
jgi:hypothetical protein